MVGGDWESLHDLDFAHVDGMATSKYSLRFVGLPAETFGGGEVQLVVLCVLAT